MEALNADLNGCSIPDANEPSGGYAATASELRSTRFRKLMTARMISRMRRWCSRSLDQVSSNECVFDNQAAALLGGGNFRGAFGR